MLLTYFILLSLMFVVLLIGGVLGFVFRFQVEDNLRPEMRHTIEEYDPSNKAGPITAAWDDTQRYVRRLELLLDVLSDCSLRYLVNFSAPVLRHEHLQSGGALDGMEAQPQGQSGALRPDGKLLLSLNVNIQ